MEIKIKKYRVFVFLVSIGLLCSIPRFSISQELKFLHKKSIDPPQSVSTDTYGNIYITFEDGVITKYDPKGSFLNTYSPLQPAGITLFEAWKTVNTFAFYQDFQQLTLFDRQLSKGESYYFSDFDLGFVAMAAPAADDNFWVFDQVSFSLKKLDLKNREILFDSPLDLLVSNDFLLKNIREYHNLVYLNTSVGIKVFDLFGNLLKTLPFSEVRQFNFLNNEVYFLEGSRITKINLYTSEKTSISIPDLGFQFVLMRKNSIVLFSKSEMAFFEPNYE